MSKSVSYTHLDVYKRQVQGRAISDRDVEGEKNVIVISSIMQKNLYGEGSDPIGREIKVETTYGTESFYAVSYTHLDVYKRQGCGRPDRFSGRG